MNKLYIILIFIIPCIVFSQIKHGSLVSINESDDTTYIPLVLLELDLDHATILAFIGKDTLKPSTIAIILSANDSLNDKHALISNPYGADIYLSRDTISIYSNIIKKFQIVGTKDLSWYQFESLCKNKSFAITINKRSINLTNDEMQMILNFQDYLLTEHEEEPPDDFAGYDQEPVVINQIAPRYPDEALKKGNDGEVILKAWIDTEGKVKKIIIAKSTDDIFNKNAIEAVTHWTFSPAKFQGDPMAVWITIPLRFRPEVNK